MAVLILIMMMLMMLNVEARFPHDGCEVQLAGTTITCRKNILEVIGIHAGVKRLSLERLRYLNATRDQFPDLESLVIRTSDETLECQDFRYEWRGVLVTVNGHTCEFDQVNICCGFFSTYYYKMTKLYHSYHSILFHLRSHY